MISDSWDDDTLPGGGKPLQTLPAGHKPVPAHIQDNRSPLAPLLTRLSVDRGLHWTSASSPETNLEILKFLSGLQGNTANRFEDCGSWIVDNILHGTRYKLLSYRNLHLARPGTTQVHSSQMRASFPASKLQRLWYVSILNICKFHKNCISLFHILLQIEKAENLSTILEFSKRKN